MMLEALPEHPAVAMGMGEMAYNNLPAKPAMEAVGPDVTPFVAGPLPRSSLLTQTTGQHAHSQCHLPRSTVPPRSRWC